MPYVYDTFASGRLQEPMPPMADGFCDFCGLKLPADARTKRGDVAKYCPPTAEDKAAARRKDGRVVSKCRKAMRARERKASAFLYAAVRDARLYKHSDPTRSNAARSAIAEFMAEHFVEIDAERAQATEEDGEQRIRTKDVRGKFTSSD